MQTHWRFTLGSSTPLGAIGMGKILSVGMDGALLRTRHTVLQQTGAEISSASPTEALRLLEFGKFDLLILCHTLTDASVAALCQILASRWPVTWAVLLGKHHRSIMKIEDRLWCSWSIRHRTCCLRPRGCSFLDTR
jgi:hypothetical protein